MIQKKILLVDDDADDRSFFSSFLGNRIDITLLQPTDNGVTLLDVIKKLKDNSSLPDLIIIDQNMPLMTGLQTLKTLKENIEYAHIPVMMYSTYITPELRKNLIKEGAMLVIDKPTDREGYHNMIDLFLHA
jgi:CheY-like chemotaxis protein